MYRISDFPFQGGAGITVICYIFVIAFDCIITSYFSPCGAGIFSPFHACSVAPDEETFLEGIPNRVGLMRCGLYMIRKLVFGPGMD